MAYLHPRATNSSHGNVKLSAADANAVVIANVEKAAASGVASLNASSKVVQNPANANLDSIAGLTTAAGKMIEFTGSGASQVIDATAAGKALLAGADAAAQRSSLGLGSAATSASGAFQPADAGLTDIAGLAVSDGNFIVGDGSNFVAESGATARTSLGLGTMAVEASGDYIAKGGGTAMTGDLTLANSSPSNALHAASKGYVDAIAQGIKWKEPVKVASSSNVTISGPGASIDSISLTSGDRVLLMGQTTNSENGIWIWSGAAAAMTRATDADTDAELSQAATLVLNGTMANKGFTQAATLSSFGTQAWAMFSSVSGSVSGGNGIAVSGSTVSVDALGANLDFDGSAKLKIATNGVGPTELDTAAVYSLTDSANTFGGSFSGTVTATGTLTAGSGMVLNGALYTGDTTLGTGIVHAAFNGTTLTCTLPATSAGRFYIIKNVHTSSNLTIDQNGSETIDGSTNAVTVYPGASVSLIGVTGGWMIV